MSTPIEQLELSQIMEWVDRRRGKSIEADIEYDYVQLLLVNAENHIKVSQHQHAQILPKKK